MNQVMSRYHCVPHYQSNRYPPTPPPSNRFGISPTTPSSPLDFTDRIPFAELKLFKETLGSGSFGTVFKGRWRGRNVAVKQFKTREEIESFLVEVKQLSCVKNENIVTLYGSSTTDHSAYLVMEYAEGGSLNHLLHECRHQQYDLRHACSWALQTARGVAYLHGLKPKPIMHRDLKPANLLLFRHGKVLKICDFGTACAVKTQMTNNTGSASYMAPEVFATSSYLESGDVFSWSIIFWETLVRKQPYTSQQYSNPFSILWKVSQGFRPNEIESCPEPIWNLITRCWNKNAKDRPTMCQVAKEMEDIFSFTDKRQATSYSNGSPIVDAKNSTLASSVGVISPLDNRNQKQQQHQQPSAIFSQLDGDDHHFNIQQQQEHHNHHLHQVSSTISSQASAGMKLQNQLHHQHQLYGQHHEFEYLQQHQILSQQQTVESQLKVIKKKRALEHHIQGLMEKSKALEANSSTRAAGESFKEFEDIKMEIKRIKDIIDKNNSIKTRSSSGSANTPQQLLSPHHQDIDINRAC